MRAGAYILKTIHGKGSSAGENFSNARYQRRPNPDPRPLYLTADVGKKPRDLTVEILSQINMVTHPHDVSMEPTEIVPVDKYGKSLSTYTAAQRRAMAGKDPIGTGPTAYATAKGTGDVSLVDLARLPYAADANERNRKDLGESINLWQARLGFPHPDLLATILTGTTGHNIDPERARTMARRTLINTLANQERSPARHKSESLPDDIPDYGNGEAWSFDTQEYTRSSQGFRHAVTFIEHNTGCPWAAYQKDKDADTFVPTVTRLQAFVKTDLWKTLRYLYTDADLSTLPREFRRPVCTSLPLQHDTHQRQHRFHIPMASNVQSHSGHQGPTTVRQPRLCSPSPP
jgi:hypothetical protein